jgi:HEAT repeat protein
MGLFGSASIEKLKVKKGVKALAAALRDQTDSERQAAAARALVSVGALQKRRDVDVLLGALDDPIPDVREIAALALHQVRDPRAIGPLMKISRILMLLCL